MTVYKDMRNPTFSLGVDLETPEQKQEGFDIRQLDSIQYKTEYTEFLMKISSEQ